MPSSRLRRVLALAVLAAGAFACALPSIALADGPHGGHFGGGHFGGGHFGGGHFGGGHFGGGHFGGGHFGGGHAVHGRAGWRGPREAWGGEHWHAGIQPHVGWRGGDWGDGRWRGRDWDGRWRGDWDDRYWTGGMWLGGYWNGLYWPPVDYDWNYPWYLGALPFGAVTIWFGSVPYYYVNQVYYVWSPSYDGYVVADPPPVAGQAQRPPSEAGHSASGVLSLRVVPRKGQDQQQAANDRYACHQWAVAQSGFNPIDPAQDAQASSTARSSYRRALTACLHARGYSVQ